MSLINVDVIAAFHDDLIGVWDESGIVFSQAGLVRQVEENHGFNYQLWHAEDRARRDDRGYEFVYLAKRDIDGFNQQRNDRVEAMDVGFFEQLKPSSLASCPVHSETPGMMIDRLSILALKSHYMHIQANRVDVDESHRVACGRKLDVLLAQRKQLMFCLQQLIDDVLQQKRTFRVYFQFKMYNDKALNPQLYSPVE